LEDEIYGVVEVGIEAVEGMETVGGDARREFGLVEADAGGIGPL